MTEETDAIQFLRSRAPSMLQGKEGGWELWASGVEESISHLRVRYEEFIPTYGFAILDSEIVDILAQLGPLLELGAGSGYWAWELRRAGIDIIATDLEPTEQNEFKFVKFWVPVEQIDAVSAVKKYPNRSLLMVWPSYAKQWPVDALRAYEGKRVIYVGEGEGGCTATDEFHHYLDQHFECVHSAALYQFTGLHDRLEVYER
jgi:hypothetical protein